MRSLLYTGLLLAMALLGAALPLQFAYAQSPDIELCGRPSTKPEAALAACTRLLEMKKPPVERSGVLFARANLRGKAGDFDGAITDLDEGLHLQPDVPMALYMRGIALGNKKQYDRAIEDFDAVLRLTPGKETEQAWAYNSRGEAWRYKREFARALADYRASLRLSPKFAQPNNNMAWVLATARQAKFRDGKEAVKLATAACEATGWKDAIPLDTLAAAYAEAGDFDRAVQWSRKAMAMMPAADPHAEDARKRQALYERHLAYRDD